MRLEQYYLGCLAHASYMIADETTGIAAVVDPQRDVDQYVRDAEANGWQIRYVFLTHFHADFLAGHIELRDRLEARIYLGAKADAEYEFTPVMEGDVVEFGEVRMKILETPGHTPEGISILVYDLAESDTTPNAVLTGDTMFIGDVGRPDLMASIGVTAEELGNMLYDSIEKLRQLPDETRVYPAHGAGSLCGKQLSEERVSTIGEQKKFNYALQPMDRAAFLDLVTADQPDAPDYFAFDAERNRQERQSLDEALRASLKALSLDEVLSAQRRGVQVVDVRDPADFEGAHLVGTINIGLDGKYATWAGTILDKAAPIVVIADSDRVEEAVMRLGRIGFDLVEGYLEHGMAALESRPDLVETTDRITAEALHEQLVSESAPLVVDVRAEKEWSGGHLEGSLNVPLNQLVGRIGEIPTERDIVVHCQGGYRSSIAASLMKHHGLANVTDLVGGYKAWVTSKLPVVDAPVAAE